MRSNKLLYTLKTLKNCSFSRSRRISCRSSRHGPNFIRCQLFSHCISMIRSFKIKIITYRISNKTSLVQTLRLNNLAALLFLLNPFLRLTDPQNYIATTVKLIIKKKVNWTKNKVQKINQNLRINNQTFLIRYLNRRTTNDFWFIIYKLLYMLK